MIGERGFAERRQPVGRRFRSWCDGRQDALARRARKGVMELFPELVIA